MSTRKPSAAVGQAAQAGGLAAWNDLPRQQMAAAAQACCTMFRGFESIRQVQQKAAHQALAHHQAIADKLKAPCQPMDLLAMQAEMLRFDLRGAAMYWQQLASAVLQMEREFLGSAASGQAEADDSGDLPDQAALNPFFFNVHGAQRAAG